MIRSRLPPKGWIAYPTAALCHHSRRGQDECTDVAGRVGHRHDAVSTAGHPVGRAFMLARPRMRASLFGAARAGKTAMSVAVCLGAVLSLGAPSRHEESRRRWGLTAWGSIAGHILAESAPKLRSVVEITLIVGIRNERRAQARNRSAPRQAWPPADRALCPKGAAWCIPCIHAPNAKSRGMLNRE
jgi:hypothetical protein